MITTHTSSSGGMSSAAPFAGHLGAVVLSQCVRAVETRLDWAAGLSGDDGAMHADALTGLAEQTADRCARTSAGPGMRRVESRSTLVGVVRAGHVLASARPVHVGRGFVIIAASVRTPEGRLVVESTHTYLS